MRARRNPSQGGVDDDLGGALQLWRDAIRARRNAEAFERLQAARKRVARNTDDDWEWLAAALADPEKKWFVAHVFGRQPVPRRLFGSMMRAAVIDVDPSTNRWLLEPCLETFGRAAVIEELGWLKQSGEVPGQRIEWALYWCTREVERLRGTSRS
ncbi:hypothetical protein ElP_75410 (plasmid) [Tautonia plasticadhaerens]|uniref:Uncharacterized protein n=2 Tax=Tautonia plasticadhaerens TaxID=2527974 RepID=A0A518HFF5_9BACT|nr:hypothetical protein ElP_75410 [Tautonia plasticadhaerens]